MIINTSDTKTVKNLIKKINFPNPTSHKGQNGKVLVIGGSSLFHAASLWTAEIASHIADMVHYYSTLENQKIFINLKSKFTNGIVIKKTDLLDYVAEDDCVVIGPGMLRGPFPAKKSVIPKNFREISALKNEAEYSYFLTKYLIESFPEKKFLFDGGAIQMMKTNWFLKLKTKPIITPHQIEFSRLFSIDIAEMTTEEKAKIVIEKARQYNLVILLKTVDDIISDGRDIFIIRGGNAGLTKGGTGDALAGLVGALNTKNSQITAAVTGSLILKKTAEKLTESMHLWYNTTNLIDQIPKTLQTILQ